MENNTIYDKFEEKALEFPDNTALIFNVEKIKYGKLLDLVNKAATFISDTAPAECHSICIACEPSIELIVIILAVIKLNATYIPLDIKTPKERLDYIIADSEANFCISNLSLETNIPTLQIDLDIIHTHSGKDRLYARSNDIAYMIYTSGSTGKPKGVRVSHSNLLNLFNSTHKLFNFKISDVWSFYHSCAFDFSVWEIFIPLLSGGTVCIVETSVKTNIEKIVDLVINNKVTYLNLTPSVFRNFLSYSLSKKKKYPFLKNIIFGGENLQLDPARQWLDSYPDINLINMFGATEVTIHATYCKLTKTLLSKSTLSPIGQPLPDNDAYVLDEKLNPVTANKKGMLYIAGPTITEGYHNQPELTSKRFLKNPFSDEPRKQVMYNTGDIVKKNPDNILYYVGRSDNQVKINGYRIELAEIEESLCSYKEINNAICYIHKIPDSNQIVAYLESQKIIDRGALINFLLEKIPSYMLPSIFKVVEKFKVNVNGKVDHEFLKKNAVELNLHSDDDIGVSETERHLLKILERSLHIKNAKVNDHFFHLGMNSFKAMLFIVEINEKNHTHVQFKDILKYQNIRNLAKYLEIMKHDKSEVKVFSASKVLLSEIQKQIAYSCQLSKNKDPLYNISFIINICGDIHKEKFLNAISNITDEYPILSSKIIETNNEQYLEINDTFEAAYQEIGKKDLKSTVTDFFKENLTKFDSPLFKSLLIKVGKQEYQLLVNVSHLIFDGWSKKVFLERLALYYDNTCGKLTPLIEYIAVEQNSKPDPKWEDYLKQSEELNFTVHKSMPNTFSFKGATIKKSILKAQQNQIHTFCKNQNLTTFQFLMTFYAYALNKYSQKQQFTIGIPINIRGNQKTLNMIGHLVKTLPVAVEFNSTSNFASLFKQIAEQLKFVIGQTSIELSHLHPYKSVTYNNSCHPLFQVMFSENYDCDHCISIDKMNLSLEPVYNNTAKFLQTLFFTQQKEQITFELEYSTDHFSEKGAYEFLDFYTNSIKLFLTSKDVKYEDFYKELVPYKLSQLKSNPPPHKKTILNKFKEIVSQYKDKVVVIHNHKKIKYQDLDKKSDLVCSYLNKHLGLKNQLIAVHMPACIDYVVTILGILKAGCFYLTINHDDPLNRKINIIHSSHCKALISNIDSPLSKSITSIYHSFEAMVSHTQTNHEDTPPTIAPIDPCYVTYSSGSTGNPKGIVVSHGALYNIAVSDNILIKHSDVSTLTPIIAFDLCIVEIWATLTSGATLAVCDKSTLLNINRYKTFLSKHKITFTFITTALFQEYVTIEPNIFDSLSNLMFGGEACSIEVIRSYYIYCQGNNQLNVYNAYGPSEATCFCLYYKICNDIFQINSIPIGRPITGCDILIVNKNNEIVPNGVRGELLLSGNCLANGYYENEEFTAKKFIYIENENKSLRYFKTADLVFSNDAGQIEYIRRIDTAVKHRGYFVEIEEITSCLTENAIVRQSFVYELKVHDTAYLVAAVVANQRQSFGSYTSDKLKKYLRDKLPSYMVPEFIVFVDRLPLSQNGKVDIAKLSQYFSDKLSNTMSNTSIPEKYFELYYLWHKVTNIRDLQIDDNYFSCGGNSLSSMRLANEISKKYHISFNAIDVLECPDIRSQYQRIQDRRMHDATAYLSFPQINKLMDSEKNVISLSAPQEQILLASTISSNKELFNIGIEFKFDRHLQYSKINDAWKKLQALEVILTSKLVRPSSALNLGFYSPAELKQINLSDDSSEKHYFEGLVETVFDLDSEQLCRLYYASRHSQTSSLFFLCHHLILDGKSIDLLLQQLLDIYDDCYDQISTVSQQQFMTFEKQLISSSKYTAAQQFWASELKGYHGLIQIPFANQNSAKTDLGNTLSFTFSSHLWEQIRGYCQCNNISMSTVFLASLYLLINKYTSQNDLTLAIPVENRPVEELTEAIGHFANIIPIRINLGSEVTIGELLKHASKVVMQSLEHQFLPMHELLNTSGLLSNPKFNPLAQILFSYFKSINFADRVYHFNNSSKHQLSFFIFEQANGATLTIEYEKDLFQESSINLMSQHFLNILKGLIGSRTANPLKNIKYFSKREIFFREQFINTMPFSFAKENIVAKIHESFQKNTANIAIVHKGKSYSYQQLRNLTCSIESWLVKNKFNDGKKIGLFVERSIYSISSSIAIVSVNSTFVPLATDTPPNRMQKIIDECQIKLILSTSHTMKTIKVGAVQILSVDEFDPNEKYIQTPVVKNLTPENEAYIIYTSGTTGNPKGIAISNLAISNSIRAIFNRLEINCEDRLLATFSPAFDASMLDIFVPLFAGASIYILDDNQKIDVEFTRDFIRKNKISIIPGTPGLLSQLTLNSLNTHVKLKFVNVGENITEDIAQTVLRQGILYNFYGPSEATVFASGGRIMNSSNITLGKTLMGYSIYLLNEDLRQVCTDVPGKIYIASRSLALSYLNNPQLTNKKFITLNIGNKKERLYNTGDFAKINKYGELIYLGRKDRQIKYHGYRIELGDIEKVIIRYAPVQKCICYLYSKGKHKVQLLAFYLPIENTTFEHDLKSICAQHLPNYMRPNRFIPINNVPLTKNGKINFNELEQCYHSYKTPMSSSVKLTSNQNTIALIWRKLLDIKLEEINENSDFFQLGGNSILLMQFVSLLKFQYNNSIPAHVLFKNPTLNAVSGLVGSVTLEKKMCIKADLKNKHDTFPLTETQQAYWLGRSSTFEIGNISTHVYIEFEFDTIDVSKLEHALNKLIQRHDMLRAIVNEDGTQKILSSTSQYVIQTKDFSGLSNDGYLKALNQLRDQLSHQIIDVYHWPLFNIEVSRSNAAMRVHISMDGIITDAQSFFIFLNEWSAIYLHEEDKLRPITLSYRDYIIEYHRLQARCNTDKQYWQEKLSSLPLCIQLPLKTTPNAISAPIFKRVSSSVKKVDYELLKNKCKESNLELSAVLLASFGIILDYWSEKDDFIIKLTTLNRLFDHESINDIFGDFTSLTLFEVFSKQIGSQTFNEYFNYSQELLLNNLDHNLYNAIHVERDMISKHKLNPLATIAPIVFSCFLTDYDILNDHLFGKKIKSNYSITQTSQVWLDTKLFHEDGNLILEWEYVDQLIDDTSVACMNQLFQALIYELCHCDWSQSITQVFQNIVYSEVKYEIDCHIDYPQTPLGLIKDTYYKNVFTNDKNKDITYAKLHNFTLQITQKLCANNFQPDQLAAIMLPKSYQQVAASIAVLNCGGAFVPLNLDWPIERCLNILIDNDISYLILNDASASLLEKHHLGKSLNIINITNLCQNKQVSSFSKRLQSLDKLAYVIFTSGTTGKPKGVMISHSQANNTIADINSKFSVNATDKIISLSSFSFDLSIYDYFGALAVGASIVFVESRFRNNPEYIFNLLSLQRVTVWNSVPMLLLMLIEYLESLNDVKLSLPSVRLIFLSGDWIPTSLPHKAMNFFPNSRIISLGGATEGSIWSINHEITDLDKKLASIPYGRALNKQSMSIRNRNLLPLPPNTIGEIFIGGSGVAMGYYKNTLETNYRFTRDPVLNQPLYKTGDLGFINDNDKNMILLGRNDNQVKINGYRVELGEIEAKVLRNTSVKYCSILAKKINQHTKVYAFIEFSGEDQALMQLELTKIKIDMNRSLPKYMQPQQYFVIDQLPLSANGKVDHKQLLKNIRKDIEPRLEQKAQFKTVEQFKLLNLWEDIINIHIQSPADNFFHLGGSSIHALRLSLAINKLFGLKIPISWVFQHPTIMEQAELLTKTNNNSYWPLIKYRQAHSIPIIIIHPGDGGAESYYELTKQLDSDLSIYIIDSINLYSDNSYFLSIEELAEFYVSKLLPELNSEEIILAGWSLGGTIAYEMAHILEKYVKVKTLILIDSFNFLSSEKILLKTNKNRILKELAQREDAVLASKEYRDKLLKVADIEANMLISYVPKISSIHTIVFKATLSQTISDNNLVLSAFLNSLLLIQDNNWSETTNLLKVINIDASHQSIIKDQQFIHALNTLLIQELAEENTYA